VKYSGPAQRRLAEGHHQFRKLRHRFGEISGLKSRGASQEPDLVEVVRGAISINELVKNPRGFGVILDGHCLVPLRDQVALRISPRADDRKKKADRRAQIPFHLPTFLWFWPRVKANNRNLTFIQRTAAWN
jgi:hypothetical protein